MYTRRVNLTLGILLKLSNLCIQSFISLILNATLLYKFIVKLSMLNKHWGCTFSKGKLLYISGANMSILGPNMYILGVNMYMLGDNMNILGANMYH